MKLSYKWLFIEVFAEIPRTWGTCTHYTLKSVSEGFFCACFSINVVKISSLVTLIVYWYYTAEKTRSSVLLVVTYILIGMQ